MSFSLIYPVVGRGSFSTNAQLGGTLNVKGDGPGPYYRAPASAGVPMPGIIGALAVKFGSPCNINDYAVFMAVKALQAKIGTQADGILGPNSDKAIKAYQVGHSLVADGVIGPKTCKLMFDPLIVAAVEALDRHHEAAMMWMAKGHMWVESGYDPGAVGVSTPQDLGPGLNGEHNPEMTAEFRLNPSTAIPAMVRIVDGNIYALKFNIDAAVLSYNIGRGGATSWVRAGKPAMFMGVDTYAYINKVRAGGI